MERKADFLRDRKPTDVDENLRSHGFLRSVGPHSPSTVRRRLANWSTLTKCRGLDGVFASPSLNSAIRLAVPAVPRMRGRKSAKAVSGEVLAKRLKTCATDSLRVYGTGDPDGRLCLRPPPAQRDCRIALRAAKLRAPIAREEALPSPLSPDMSAEPRPPRASGRCRLSELPVGGGAECLDGGCQDRQWERVSGDRALGTVSKPAIDPQSVNTILKKRAQMAGLESGEFSAHGLRSG